MAREYLRLARGRGRLTLQEYVHFRVYDPRLSDDERSRFVSERLHWPIVHQCNDVTWQGSVEDKWLCARLLDGAGLPTPSILAAIDTTERTYPGTPTIRTASALRELILAHCRDGMSLFCKPVGSLASFGAFVATAAEPDRLCVEGEGWISYDACLAEFIGDERYLVQPVQRNHPFLGQYTDSLATVRVYLMHTDTGVMLPFAALKLAAPGNIADNYWRPGNLVCDVDPATGLIRTARTRHEFGTTDHVEHPDTGARLVGETLPMWCRIVRLARECANIFAPVRYKSMDIAILEDGPSVIEINTGGAFNIPQFARGRGFLADEVLDFLRTWGYKG